MCELSTPQDRIAFLNAGCLFDAAMELFDRPAFFALTREIIIACEGEVVRAYIARVSVYEDDPRDEYKAESLEPDLANGTIRLVQAAHGNIVSLRLIHESVFFQTHDKFPTELHDLFHVF